MATTASRDSCVHAVRLPIDTQRFAPGREAFPCSSLQPWQRLCAFYGQTTQKGAYLCLCCCWSNGTAGCSVTDSISGWRSLYQQGFLDWSGSLSDFLCLDPGYFRACLEFYDSNAVERVAEKIFDNGGNYPIVHHSDRINQLNHALHLLATEIFPDCDVGYLREKLQQQQHSLVENVTDELLLEARWPERLEFGKIDRADYIKSESYKAHALHQLSLDYPQVSRKQKYDRLSECFVLIPSYTRRSGNHQLKLFWPKTTGIMLKVTINSPKWDQVDCGWLCAIFLGIGRFPSQDLQ